MSGRWWPVWWLDTWRPILSMGLDGTSVDAAYSYVVFPFDGTAGRMRLANYFIRHTDRLGNEWPDGKPTRWVSDTT
jgi:hypothetical protein